MLASEQENGYWHPEHARGTPVLTRLDAADEVQSYPATDLPHRAPIPPKQRLQLPLRVNLAVGQVADIPSRRQLRQVADNDGHLAENEVKLPKY